MTRRASKNESGVIEDHASGALSFVAGQRTGCKWARLLPTRDNNAAWRTRAGSELVGWIMKREGGRPEKKDEGEVA